CLAFLVGGGRGGFSWMFDKLGGNNTRFGSFFFGMIELIDSWGKIESTFNIEHFSASNLIAKEKAEENLLNKQVENITGNQDFLVTAINKYFKSETWYLLDGHFCLLNKNNEITKIPYS
ncbi:MAG: hypothetical protein ACKOPK_04055, partial [Dolichospermum sp.]